MAPLFGQNLNKHTKDYLCEISKNFFGEKDFERSLETETQFLHFSIFKVLPKCL